VKERYKKKREREKQAFVERWKSDANNQFHQHSTGSFYANSILEILLAHSIKSKS
jgi:hypothetical protein